MQFLRWSNSARSRSNQGLNLFLILIFFIVNNNTEHIKKEGPYVFDRGDEADSIPFYRGQFMKEGLLIKDV
jgi:hypothetical protein